MAKGTPIEPGMIARALAGFRYAMNGSATPTWMAPGTPTPPPDPPQDARAWDYPVAYNQTQQPRYGEPVTFAQLRALADGYDLLRLVIETRKDQMSRLRFHVVPNDQKLKPDKRCTDAEAFFRSPDAEHDWGDWLRLVLEDLLVLDAPVLYPRMNQGGALYALEPIDGATIKRVIGLDGRTPMLPDPAYQQVIKGSPALDFNRDELIYKPRNIRTAKVYGYGPVEQIIMTVNISIRRQLYQLQQYTEGSTPDLIMALPETWTTTQIQQFDTWWQLLLSGNTANRARTMFVPGGAKPLDTKEKALQPEADEWLARIICYAFGISPQSFVTEVNRATAQTSKSIANEEGMQPIMAWVKSLIDLVLAKHFRWPDLELKWADEPSEDAVQRAGINKIYLDARVVTVDEIRAELGRDPMTDEQKAELAPKPPPAPLGPGGKPLPVAAPVGVAAPGNADGGAAVGKAQKKSSYTRLTGSAQA